MAEQLPRILSVLEPVTAALWDLVRLGCEANWFRYVASHPTEHAAELGWQTMQRLLALPGDLWLDVCGDDRDDEDHGQDGHLTAGAGKLLYIAEFELLAFSGGLGPGLG